MQQFHPGDLSISALGLYWHPGHLKCACCTAPLGIVQGGADDDAPRSTDLSTASAASAASAVEEDGQELSSYYEMDGQAYCENDYLRVSG
jgi:hypothetical protein